MGRIALIDADETAYKIALKYQRKWYHVRKDGVLKWKYHLKDEAAESIGNRDDLEIEEFMEVLDPSGAEDDVDRGISNILHRTSSTDYRCYLSGSSNFRYNLATLQSYKGQATRDDSTKPVHLQLVKDIYLRKGAVIVDFLEADDLLSAAQTLHAHKGVHETIICSSDKDLRTVPGLNYNINKKKIEMISQGEADYNFFYQLLIGDGVDNIPSPYLLGPITAIKFLDPLMGSTPKQYYEAIVPFYLDFLSKKGTDGKYKTKWYDGRSVHDVLWEVGNLLWMRRTLDEEERWSVDTGKT
jgi:hypothetical protein